MHGIDQFLTGKRMNPGLVFTSPSTYLGHDHKVIRIRMKGLSNDLVGDMWTVIVAGIDMIDAGRNRLSQNSHRNVDIIRWSEHSGTGKLHRAIAHAVHWHCGAR